MTAVTFLCAAILIIYIFTKPQSQAINQQNRNLNVLTTGFALIILIPAAAHGLALLNGPANQLLNVSQIKIGDWIASYWYFSEIYLFFPLCFALLLHLLRPLSVVYVSRVIAVLLALSVSVQYYQALVDTHFMNNWVPGSGRTGGLATDPNAYQLQIFLLAPMLIALSFLENNKIWTYFNRVVACLSIIGLAFSGGRTAIGGIALLILFTPLILAGVRTDWSHGKRIALAFLPLVLLVIGGFALANLAPELRQFGLLGIRIAETIEKTRTGGIQGLLFDNEARGFFWQIGWILLLQAPLAGWGAGGFRLHYPNEAYVKTGEIPTWIDYVCNHYLMVPIDLGLPALLIQGMIVISTIVAGVKSFRITHSTQVRLALAILIATNILFLLLIVVMPPVFPDVVFAWALTIVVMLSLARQTRGEPTPVCSPIVTERAVFFVTGFGIFITLIGIYPVTFGKHGYQARLDIERTPLRHDRNCFGVETNGTDRWQWCGKNARIKIPLRETDHGEFVLHLNANNPDIKNKPLLVSYGGHAGPVHELTLTNTSPVEIRIPINADYVQELPVPVGKPSSRFVVVSLDVSRTWSPKQWGISIDSRELGVAVRLPIRNVFTGNLN